MLCNFASPLIFALITVISLVGRLILADSGIINGPRVPSSSA